MPSADEEVWYRRQNPAISRADLAYDEEPPEVDYCYQVPGCTFVDTCSFPSGTYAECSCHTCG
jgi:hypothetical protein